MVYAQKIDMCLKNYGGKQDSMDISYKREEKFSILACLDYCSTGMKGHHYQGNIYKKSFDLGLVCSLGGLVHDNKSLYYNDL